MAKRDGHIISAGKIAAKCADCGTYPIGPEVHVNFDKSHRSLALDDKERKVFYCAEHCPRCREREGAS